MSTGFLQTLLILSSVGIITAISSGKKHGGLVTQSSQIDTTVYTVVQVPPTFPGGDEAMFTFIRSASQYPVNLEKGSLVQLKLLIERDGSVSKVELVYTDATEDSVREAKRVAQMMPKWIPGSQDGQLLRVYAVVPIRFVNLKKS
ncbi:MAG: hypothetical protein EOO39_04315 [Cytophagaceae bacterium]|nr:MAG: hypothetical protein EOO39_04315 [Cytophagaceae bacterium]